MKIYNLIVLDKSGSMSSMREEAINGCNNTFKSIRKQNETESSQLMEHVVTLVLFDTSGIDTLYHNEPAERVRDITKRDYAPCGGTPLYDALGISLNKLKAEINKEEGYGVFVTVITDGEENASVEYSFKDIRGLIGDLRGEGWAFTYIGADHDVEKVAVGLNFDTNIRFEKTKEGMDSMWSNTDNMREDYMNALKSVKWAETEELRSLQRSRLNSEFFKSLEDEK